MAVLVLNKLKTRGPIILKNLGREKAFEISPIELADFKIIIVCTYRSTNGNEEIFLEFSDEAVRY
jgi:hypothetical protein